MSKLRHVETLTSAPVVGQRYLVPAIVYPWFGSTEAWPVMGPKHTDAEHIGFDVPHFHVDVRFLSDAQVRRIERRGRFGDIESIAAGYPLATSRTGSEAEPHPEPVFRRLTCRRPGHGYPRHAAGAHQGLRALAAAYAGRKCGRNGAGLLVCPHKGFVLGSLEPDAERRVVCPLHGLVVDVATGSVVGGGACAEAA